MKQTLKNKEKKKVKEGNQSIKKQKIKSY